VTKLALPALVILIFGLFYYSVTSPSPDMPLDLAAPVAEPAQPRAAAEAAGPVRDPQLASTIEGIRAELKRLSDDTKANSDRIAQAVTPRADPQDVRPGSDRPDQNLLDQIAALRSDQAKLLNDARETGDRAAQALRQEFAAFQARLVDRVGDTLKADAARSEALAQRVEAMNKDIDEVKKSLEEDRQNVSNISPGLALVVALAALVLGPFVARQFTANQLAAARRQDAAEARVAAQPVARPAASTAEAGPPLAPPSAAEPPQEAFLHHEEAPPTSGEEASPHRDADANQKAAPDSEKV
jgi:hypothetical protein